MNNYDYPEGSDTIYAPWNEIKYEEKEIEVEVTITLTRVFKIKVDDYKVLDRKRDELDYSCCDLEKAVKNQIDFPEEWEIQNMEVEQIE